MGQTASQLDKENPNPQSFQYPTKYQDGYQKRSVENECDESFEDDCASYSTEKTPISSHAGTHKQISKIENDVEEVISELLSMQSLTISAKKSQVGTHEIVLEGEEDDEDEIDEDQAKEDLLAYIKIVGENASNLPMTWRDDPELERMVSGLTSREYAQKADAFIPCDVRIIGATNLPRTRKTLKNTLDEIKISERATEPTVSSGGAVSNCLLKALYDFEHEVDLNLDSSYINYDADDNLFRDDDPFEDDCNEENSIGSLQFDNVISNSLTWSGLIRRMKDEMEDQGYNQIPILTTSRKFNLEEPVHLLPPDFDPKRNRKFALLVGCGYTGRYGELRNTHNDIKITKDYIVNVHGFPDNPTCMKVLMDDGQHPKPTTNNIIRAMKEIALKSRPGDAVFIQFVGHGGRLTESCSGGSENYDEVFAPVDYHNRGFISEKTIFRSLLARIAEDVTVTILLDASESGIVFDLPYSWEIHDDNEEIEAKLSINETFSFNRLFNVVRQMYDSSAMDNNEDELGFENSKTMVQALEFKMRNAAIDAEVEVNNLTKKAKKVAAQLMQAVEDMHTVSSDDSYDDRNERYSRNGKGSYESSHQGSYESSWGSSYDSYEHQIR